VQQQHPAPRPGAGGVAQLAAGVGPEPLVSLAERRQAAGPGQRVEPAGAPGIRLSTAEPKDPVSILSADAPTSLHTRQNRSTDCELPLAFAPSRAWRYRVTRGESPVAEI
jgi:hypothetical protein